MNPGPTRRSFLGAVGVIVGSAVVAGCGREKLRQGSATNFLGDQSTPGAPLWAEDPGAYIVAIPTGEELPREAIGTSPALLLLRPVCSNDQRRVGWCVASEHFVCPNCRSVFTITGAVVSGPAPRGLDRLRASVRATTGELTADSANPGRGPERAIDTPKATPADVDAVCVTLRFPPTASLNA